MATKMAHWASHYRMPRWFTPALFLLTMAVGPAFAQFGGIQLPGMGRNRGGYPGQNPNGSQNTNKVYGPTETLTGSIQRISSSDLVIDAGDDRVVLVVIQNGTKYLSTMDKVKASDFEPGDHVTVEATRDSNDHYYSKTITMNKKGTAEDKAAAMKAENASSHSGGGGGGSSDSDSDPDRPRLKRTNSDSASASAPSASPPEVGVSSSNAGSTGSSSNSPGRAVSAPSANSSPSSSGDDSGPPVLRRGSPAASAAPAQAASSSSQPAGVRPSLSADDANGVTRVPVIPPSTTVPDNSPADRDIGVSRSGRYDNGGDPVIEQAREAAFSFTDTLPNYVVKQITNRFATGQANRGRTSWQPLDIVTTDLIYEDGKERYTNIMVNGKSTKYIEQTGSWSEGEFASMLQAILGASGRWPIFAISTPAPSRTERPIATTIRWNSHAPPGRCMPTDKPTNPPIRARSGSTKRHFVFCGSKLQHATCRAISRSIPPSPQSTTTFF